MLTKSLFATSILAACAAAAPRPQDGNVSGYTNADASFSVTFEPAETPATVFGPASQVPVSILYINESLSADNYSSEHTQRTRLSTSSQELRSEWCYLPRALLRHALYFRS